MNRSKQRFLLKAMLSTGLFLGLMNPADARNGFIPHYAGTHGLIAGAGTAYPMDAANVIANPAVLGRLPSHVLVMLGILHQDQYLDSSAAPIGNLVGRQKNRLADVTTSAMGFNYRLNEKWAVGFGLSGGGGFVKFNSSLTNPAFLNPPNGNFNNMAVNNVILTAPSIAYTPDKSQSYGMSLLIATSYFKTNLALSDAGNIQVRAQAKTDRSFGTGVRIGGIWDINKLLTLGASAATPVFFYKHNKYKDLFKYPMQIPGTIRLGSTWHLSADTDFVFDLKKIFYGEAKWLNQDTGWRNQFIVLTGIHHRFTEKFAAGIGYNYGKAPIGVRNVLVNALSIPLDEHHISGGVTYDVSKGVQLIAVAYYTPKKKMVDNGEGMPGGVSRGTILESKAYGGEVGVKVSW